MNIVLDTNCLLMSLSRKSRYYPVWRDFKTDARFIVTEDHHFDVLRHVTYPKINVIDIDEFLDYLELLD